MDLTLITSHTYSLRTAVTLEDYQHHNLIVDYSKSRILVLIIIILFQAAEHHLMLLVVAMLYLLLIIENLKRSMQQFRTSLSQILQLQVS